MGIVAICPNGHRIKVKDELAGRKGICPTCATRFRIPRKTPAADGGASTAATAAVPMARFVSFDQLLAASLPAALPLEDVAPGAGGEPEGDAAELVPDFSEVAAEPDHVASTVSFPALAERPDLAWCYAVRGGGPSAPLAAATLRTWLESGAATVDHVVWRADWPEWRPLADVFPDALEPRPRGWP